MSVDVHPKIIFLYFDNHLNYLKAKNLHLFCVAGSIRYVSSKTRSHSSNYKCHCFKCLVCRLLLTILVSSGRMKLLLIVTSRNYLSITNQYIYDSLEHILEHILEVSSKLGSIQQFCEFSE